MKARIINDDSGRVYEMNAQSNGLFWCEHLSRTFTKDKIEEVVDWDAFRREAAKDILCSMVRGGYGWGRETEQARLAVSYAGELIKALKEEQK